MHSPHWLSHLGLGFFLIPGSWFFPPHSAFPSPSRQLVVLACPCTGPPSWAEHRVTVLALSTTPLGCPSPSVPPSWLVSIFSPSPQQLTPLGGAFLQTVVTVASGAPLPTESRKIRIIIRIQPITGKQTWLSQNNFHAVVASGSKLVKYCERKLWINIFI